MAAIRPYNRLGTEQLILYCVWQPDEVVDPESGHRVALADAPDSLLCHDTTGWTPKPGERWMAISCTRSRRQYHSFQDGMLSRHAQGR
jgi:hypothetical protein